MSSDTLPSKSKNMLKQIFFAVCLTRLSPLPCSPSLRLASGLRDWFTSHVRQSRVGGTQTIHSCSPALWIVRHSRPRAGQTVVVGSSSSSSSSIYSVNRRTTTYLLSVADVNRCFPDNYYRWCFPENTLFLRTVFPNKTQAFGVVKCQPHLFPHRDAQKTHSSRGVPPG